MTISLAPFRKTQLSAQLRDDVRRRLEAVAAARARRATGNSIMDKLMSAHDFPLPPSLVENALNQYPRGGWFGGRGGAERKRSFAADVSQRTRNLGVKGALLIAAIAKAENISATPRTWPQSSRPSRGATVNP